MTLQLRKYKSTGIETFGLVGLEMTATGSRNTASWPSGQQQGRAAVAQDHDTPSASMMSHVHAWCRAAC